MKVARTKENSSNTLPDDIQEAPPLKPVKNHVRGRRLLDILFPTKRVVQKENPAKAGRHRKSRRRMINASRRQNRRRK